MNEVATTTPNDMVLVPEAKAAEIQQLEAVLIASQTQIRTATALTRAFTTAAALRKIEEAMTPEIMKDILALMDSPIGFKTDRRPGSKDKKGSVIKPYHETTVKRCVIVALLSGASLAGNEFNILVGQAYFTKEFFERAVNEWPGISHVEVEVGVAHKLGDKTVAMPATARWLVNGEQMEMKFEKKPEDQGGADMRIVCTTYATDSADLLRGKGLSKVYRRVFARLSGLNLGSAEDPADMTGGDTPQQITDKSEQPALTDESGKASDTGEKKPFKASEDPHYKEAVAFYNSAKEVLVATTTIGNCDKVYKEKMKDMNSTPWSPELFDEVSANFKELADEHKETMRRKPK